MKKGYLCADGKHMNVTGTDIDGLDDESYLADIEWMQVTEIAHAVEINYSAFKNLKSLMISSIEPCIMPKDICRLPSLETLVCSGECLLPAEIAEAKVLKSLSLNGKSAVRVPETITTMKELRSLEYSDYCEVPIPMPRWIAKMEGLDELYFNVCKLTDIDPNIANLPNLNTLCFWHALSYTAYIPNLSNLKNLNRLDALGSGCPSIPKPSYHLFEQVLEAIKELGSITSLDLSGWRSRKKSDYLILTEKGKSVPDIFERYPLLESLSLADMKIDFLPQSVFDLKHLKRLDISGNNISKTTGQGELKPESR